jgi:tetratricopeptide (TPR) repeat protein
MPPVETPKISPEKQQQLQKIFAYGNQQVARLGYDTANDMFAQCVLGDPSNVLYLKSFIANLKKLYPERKKKGVLAVFGKKAVSGSKNPEQSFELAIKTIKTNPWDVNALLSAGAASEERGYHESSVEYYKAAVEADPFDFEANRICAEALREIADYDGAISCVNRILKNKQQDPVMMKLRRDLETEKTIHVSKIATGDANRIRGAAATSTHTVIAQDEDVMGRPLTYIEQVERRIKKNPNDLANYIELAQHFYQQNDYANAEKYYAQAAKVSDAPDVVERLLDTQKQRLHHNVVAMQEEYTTANPARKAEIKGLFEPAKAEYEAKNLELAEYRIKQYPNHAGFHFEYGVLLQRQKKIKEAIGEFQQAKSDITKKAECLLALGQCFQLIKQDKLAMTHYQEAVEVLPEGENKKKTLYLATKLAFALKDYDNAEKYGLQLAAIDFAYKDLGEVLEKVNQAKGK